MGYFLTLLALMLCYIGLVQGKKCRALTMSGGGDKGPYQAAVFRGLVNNLPEEEVTYDVLVGVSAGALNSLALSPFEPHQVHEAANFAYALWNTIPQYDAYGFWPGGVVDGIFNRKGVLDISPGMEWVREQFQNYTVNRKVTFTSTDANTGAYNPVDYNATGTQPEGYIEAVFASCIIPFAFGQIQIGDKSLIDGGCKWKLDVISAIRRCREVVDDDSDIIVDLVICNNPSIAKKDDVDKYNAFGHMLRAMELKDYYNTLNDYNSSMALFPNVTFRYLITPSESITSGLIPLNYNQEQIDRCFRVGEKDAKNAVKLGPGGYAKVIYEYTEKLNNREKADFEEMIKSKILELENKASLEST